MKQTRAFIVKRVSINVKSDAVVEFNSNYVIIYYNPSSEVINAN